MMFNYWWIDVLELKLSQLLQLSVQISLSIMQIYGYFEKANIPKNCFSCKYFLSTSSSRTKNATNGKSPLFL